MYSHLQVSIIFSTSIELSFVSLFSHMCKLKHLNSHTTWFMSSWDHDLYVYEAWNGSLVSDNRQQELTNAQDKAPPRSYLEAMEALLKWITNMESLLSTETFQVTECEVMKEQLKQFRVRWPQIQSVSMKSDGQQNQFMDRSRLWCSLYQFVNSVL